MLFGLIPERAFGYREVCSRTVYSRMPIEGYHLKYGFLSGFFAKDNDARFASLAELEKEILAIKAEGVRVITSRLPLFLKSRELQVICKYGKDGAPRVKIPVRRTALGELKNENIT